MDADIEYAARNDGLRNVTRVQQHSTCVFSVLILPRPPGGRRHRRRFSGIHFQFRHITSSFSLTAPRRATIWISVHQVAPQLPFTSSRRVTLYLIPPSRATTLSHPPESRHHVRPISPRPDTPCFSSRQVASQICSRRIKSHRRFSSHRAKPRHHVHVTSPTRAPLSS